MGGFRGGGGVGVPDFGSNSSVPGGPLMTVPDRILLGGNNAHVAARGTTRPRELQLENSILPNHSPEHVRVYTPPRSIRLDDNSAFPSAAGPASSDFRSSHCNFAQFLVLVKKIIDLSSNRTTIPFHSFQPLNFFLGLLEGLLETKGAPIIA